MVAAVDAHGLPLCPAVAPEERAFTVEVHGFANDDGAGAAAVVCAPGVGAVLVGIRLLNN